MSTICSAARCRVLTQLLWAVSLATVVAAAGPDPLDAQPAQPAALVLSGLFGSGAVDGELGLTGGVGAALFTSRYVVRALFDLHLVEPDDSAYSWETGSDGAECREKESGLIVDSSRCGFDRALTGLSTDASLMIPAFGGGFHVGAGYRIGSGSTAYGLLGYAFNPEGKDWNLLFRVIGGRDLLGLQAVASLPVRSR